MAGRHSGCMWPGGDFDYNGINCTFRRSFDKSFPLEKRVDEAMEWLTHETTPANLVMLYFEQPDGQSHIFGPESMEVSYLNNRSMKLSFDLYAYLKNRCFQIFVPYFDPNNSIYRLIIFMIGNERS